MEVAYAVFSDESSHTVAQYRSIAAVSIPVDYVKESQNKIFDILKISDADEFKWSKLKNAKYRLCAIELIDYLMNELIRKDCRVDVLIWDTQDRRHNVIGRDDISNFERMFFHLHKNLMQRREFEAQWYLCPDERTDLNWEDIRSCLKAISKWKEYFNHPLLKNEFSKRFFSIQALKEVDSLDRPLCQIADLFAGIGAYTRKKANLIKQLNQAESNQGKLFKTKAPQSSNADQERIKIIDHLYLKSKRKRLGLSLKTHGYFLTHNPQNPINFWHYTPQHEKDKAPKRNEN